MEKLILALGQSRTSKFWKNTEITWEALLERLKTTTRTTESQGEYRNMAKSQQDNIKDVGGFVGGKLKGGSRKAENVQERYILSLDADYAPEDFIDSLHLFTSFAWCAYSTHKHTAEKPRLRVLIPLNRPVKPDEYEAIARKVAEEMGMEIFDDTTYQAHRLMYWPSTSMDGEYVFQSAGEIPLDVDVYLAKYVDWRDVSSWPLSSRAMKAHDKFIKKQEDPWAKKGIIGTFCRTYSVEDSIEKFLPEVYTACDLEGRYTYALGSSAAGAVVYENGRFLFSNHATDPISGKLCNAFDLVRIHKFGELDDAAAEGTPTIRLPSYEAMQEFASADGGVKKQLHKERMEGISQDFGNLIEDENENDDWIQGLEIDSKNRVISTIDNAKKILVHDPLLKGKAAFNEFTGRHKIMGKVPWNIAEDNRDWSDTDDAGLRHYLEKTYELKGKDKIGDAWILTAEQNRFHPVRDYLEELVWDGENRLESLFIDYLGAEDSDYVRIVTKKTLTAAVARIFEPGIKYDTMLVLVGPQGCGKSQILKRLGKDWFSDTLTTMQGKEAYEQLQGFWLIEVAELAAMRKIEIESIKHFVAKSEDSFRVSYGRHIGTYKRQCVFFGTTNTHEFLRDITGNRRFWPVDVMPERATKGMWQELDVEEIDQIWAEAVVLYKEGFAIHINDDQIKKVIEIEQERHFDESPMTGSVHQYLDKLIPEPEKWNVMDLGERRMFLQGDDFGNEPKGSTPRLKVCALEVWCEMFNGDKKDFTMQKSKEIKGIILKTGDWEPMKYPVLFGKLYGNQRGFDRIEKL